MAGDTYQAPAFAWLHAARAAGSSAITTVDAVTAATPKSWLCDGRATRRVVRSASGNMRLRLDRSILAREPVDTLVIPPGHNLAGHRISIYYDTNHNGAWSATTNIAWRDRLRSSTGGLHSSKTIEAANRTIRAGLNVFRFVSTPYRYVGVTIEGRASNVAELGEWWLTRAWSPTYGFDKDYATTLSSNVTLTQLVGGGVTATEDGYARRAWRFATTYVGVYGADAMLYERLLAETGVKRDPWLFEPPSGGYETTLSDADSTSGWTGTDATLSTSSTNPFITGQAFLRANTSANPAYFFRTFTEVDMRGKILAVPIRVSSMASGSATDGIRLTPYQDGTTAVSYAFGTNHIGTNNSWFVLYVDFETDTPVSHSSTGFNPTRIGGLRVDSILSSGVNIDVSDIHVIDKARAPLIVRTVADVDARQTIPYPNVGNGERRSYSFSLIEAVE